MMVPRRHQQAALMLEAAILHKPEVGHAKLGLGCIAKMPCHAIVGHRAFAGRFRKFSNRRGHIFLWVTWGDPNTYCCWHIASCCLRLKFSLALQESDLQYTV